VCHHDRTPIDWPCQVSRCRWTCDQRSERNATEQQLSHDSPPPSSTRAPVILSEGRLLACNIRVTVGRIPGRCRQATAAAVSACTWWLRLWTLQDGACFACTSLQSSLVRTLPITACPPRLAQLAERIPLSAPRPLWTGSNLERLPRPEGPAVGPIRIGHGDRAARPVVIEGNDNLAVCYQYPVSHTVPFEYDNSPL